MKGVETVAKNDKGQILKITLKDPKGQVLKQQEFLYNEKDQLIKKLLINSDYNGFGDLPAGNFLRAFYFEKEVYSYDTEGKLILRQFYSDGKVVMEDIFHYK